MKQLAIEKVIVAGGHGKVRLRPLGPGHYAFVGEFNAAIAQGTIIAKKRVSGRAGSPSSSA